MKAAIYDTAGTPDVLRYAEVMDPVCGADEVLIRVEAISIEGGDLINRALAPPPHAGFIVGFAAAGEIIAVGQDVHDRKIGQRVTSFDGAGSHAELRAVSARQTWLVPDAVAIADAAVLPIAFGTAHHSLFARGHLAKGQTVLIQAGAGGVGLAAIQLAHRAGASVIATLSGSDRAPRLRALGADHVIDYRAGDVVAAVMEMTGDRGVDLVIDPVGSTLQQSLAVLRAEGRLVFVGNAGGPQLTVDLWPALQANQSLLGVFMGSQFTTPQVYPTVSQMLEQVAKGELSVVINRSFALAEAAAAHAYAQSSALLGRVVMVP